MKVDVTSASAGSGKTYHLAQTALAAIQSGEARPEAIVAITYTKKAASELGHRLRTRLISGGHTLSAARIRDGFLGTVHSVSQRMLSELAFENGRSPYPAVIPESYAARLFRLASNYYSDSRSKAFQNAVRAFDMRVDDGRDKAAFSADGWRDHLGRIVRSMRENRMSPEQLAAFAGAAATDAATYYDKPVGDAVERDQVMRGAFEALLVYFESAIEADRANGKDPSKALYSRQAWAREFVSAFERGTVPRWGELQKVGKLPKKDAAAAKDAESIFAEHLSHPRFHEESALIIEQLFAHAASAEAAYTTAKQQERLNDYEDILAEAASVLTSEQGQIQFAGRIDLVLVDEFQDTSPVQLQIITALASLAKRTVWVGDRKQAIFGFQGSDPELMLQAQQYAVGPGGKPEVLHDSYRSRPPLVDFCSELFARALEHYGFGRDEVVLKPKCPEPRALAGTPGLHLWQLAASEKGRPREADGIAAAVNKAILEGRFSVRERLADPTQLAPVRPAGPGDFAVLARKNSDCAKIAKSLLSLGVPATVGENQLNQTPELWTVRAALSLLVDESDALAAAELATFCGEVHDPDDWLEARIAEVAEASKNGAKPPLPFVGLASVDAIRSLAESASTFTPSEAVVAVVEALNLLRVMTGWPQASRRRANLEVLKGVARDYEDICRARRSAATIPGLVRHLDELPNSVRQAAGDNEDAVRVLTYHRSKGLEWPVVICTSLNDDPWERYFGVRVVPAEQFDPVAPLAGRELRFLPWPYGGKSTGLELHSRVATSAHGKAELSRERAERARLLYVGFTRARDHLVLVRGVRGETAWLDELVGADGEVLLAELPWASPGVVQFELGETSHEVQVAEPIPCSPLDSGEPRPDARPWFAASGVSEQRLPQAIIPSSHKATTEEAAGFEIVERVSIGKRQSVRVDAGRMASLGDVVHSFIAADTRSARNDPARQAMAIRLLEAHGFAGMVSADLLVECSDRFFTWLEALGATNPIPECPVQYAREDGRMVSGDIDMLASLGDGWLLVDHKSTRLDDDGLEAKLLEYTGQLDAYSRGVEAATGVGVAQMWVHLPLRAEVIRVDARR